MSKIEEIEQAVEQLPLTDFVKLAVWINQPRQKLEIPPPATDKSQAVVRDHSAFLNSYAPQDERLYDDGGIQFGRSRRGLPASGSTNPVSDFSDHLLINRP